MNWEEIKEIIKAEGGKFIIVEDGKPTLVITSFEDYKNLALGKNLDSFGNKNKIEAISDSKKTNPGSESNVAESKKVEPADELTIEDLPF